MQGSKKHKPPLQLSVPLAVIFKILKCQNFQNTHSIQYTVYSLQYDGTLLRHWQRVAEPLPIQASSCLYYSLQHVIKHLPNVCGPKDSRLVKVSICINRVYMDACVCCNRVYIYTRWVCVVTENIYIYIYIYIYILYVFCNRAYIYIYIYIYICMYIYCEYVL